MKTCNGDFFDRKGWPKRTCDKSLRENGLLQVRSLEHFDPRGYAGVVWERPVGIGMVERPAHRALAAVPRWW